MQDGDPAGDLGGDRRGDADRQHALLAGNRLRQRRAAEPGQVPEGVRVLLRHEPVQVRRELSFVTPGLP